MHRIWTPSGGLADTRRVDVAVVERGLERWEAIGPSSVAWKINREVVLLLGWTPASYDAHNALFALIMTPAQNGQGQFNLGSFSNKRIDELGPRIADALVGQGDAAIEPQQVERAVELHRLLGLGVGKILDPDHHRPQMPLEPARQRGEGAGGQRLDLGERGRPFRHHGAYPHRPRT